MRFLIHKGDRQPFCQPPENSFCSYCFLAAHSSNCFCSLSTISCRPTANILLPHSEICVFTTLVSKVNPYTDDICTFHSPVIFFYHRKPNQLLQYARFQGGYWILPTAASSARLSPAAIRNISIISNSKSEFFLQFFRDFIRTVFHGNLIVFLRAVLGIPHLCIERVLPCHLRVSP